MNVKNKILMIPPAWIITSILFLLNISCELIDPTEVKNPSITEENLLLNSNGGAEPLVTGLKRQFAQALGYLIQFSEVTSDNYFNTDVNISTFLDEPESIRLDDLSLDGAGLASSSPYFHLQNLRALADFGIEVILPKDILATSEQKAYVHFYRGMALLLLSENFSAFPVKEKNGAITAKEALNISVNEFNIALSFTSEKSLKANCLLALARAYRFLGDKSKAEKEAMSVISLSPEHLFKAEYDPASLTNNVSFWVTLRPNNDMQPLPRLDFLDPKYTTDQSSIPVLKAEEAYLILAEIAISNGDFNGARNNMKKTISLSDTRQIVTYKDLDPRRNRPNNPLFEVKSDKDSPPVAGLLQKRGSGSTVYLYPVSATHLSDSDIDILKTKTELIYTLYLLRQEIFFLEGRRMSDLSIRWPVPKSESESNSFYPPGSPGTSAVIPAFIPRGKEMDSFIIDQARNFVICLHDMNKIIATNYDLIKPF